MTTREDDDRSGRFTAFRFYADKGAEMGVPKALILIISLVATVGPFVIELLGGNGWRTLIQLAITLCMLSVLIWVNDEFRTYVNELAELDPFVPGLSNEQDVKVWAAGLVLVVTFVRTLWYDWIMFGSFTWAVLSVLAVALMMLYHYDQSYVAFRKVQSFTYGIAVALFLVGGFAVVLGFWQRSAAELPSAKDRAENLIAFGLPPVIIAGAVVAVGKFLGREKVWEFFRHPHINVPALFSRGGRGYSWELREAGVL